MLARVLNRGKTSGRADDNEYTFGKRYQDFKEYSAPILQLFGESSVIEAGRPPCQRQGAADQAQIDCEKHLKETYPDTKAAIEVD